MKILVTGGTGFVGQRVVKDLLAQGHAVRLWTRRPVDVPGAETCHVSDLDNMAAMSDAVAGMDAICHLAGRAHVIGATPADHEAQFEKVNVEWTSKLAEASFLAGAKRFVFVSSIGAVGTSSPPGQPLTEQTECRPVTPYGRSKLKAEQILRGLAERHGGEWVAVRPPLVHGKDAPGNMARLTRLVRKGLPLPLGSVKNARSMIHVDNLSSVLLACLTHPDAPGHVFHVRDSRDYSTPDILQGIGKSLGQPARMFSFPVPLLRLAAGLAGQAAAVDQLTGTLQVDDRLVRETLGFLPRDLPFEAS